MHAELTAIHDRMQKLILVMEIVASHRLDQMNHLRLLENLAAWRRTNGFDRFEVLTERQHRTQGHVYSQMDVYFDPRWPLTSQTIIASMLFVCFVCISRTADGPQIPIPPTATLPPCLWS